MKLSKNKKYFKRYIDDFVTHILGKTSEDVRDIARWLRAFITLAEEPGSVLSTQMILNTSP